MFSNVMVPLWYSNFDEYPPGVRNSIIIRILHIIHMCSSVVPLDTIRSMCSQYPEILFDGNTDSQVPHMSSMLF